MIFNIQRFSTHDGAGIRAVLFFKGCPLRCSWCSNPESQSFDYDLMFEPRKCINCLECNPAFTVSGVINDDGQVSCNANVSNNLLPLTRCVHRKRLRDRRREERGGHPGRNQQRPSVLQQKRRRRDAFGGEPFAQPEILSNCCRSSNSQEFMWRWKPVCMCPGNRSKNIFNISICFWQT